MHITIATSYYLRSIVRHISSTTSSSLSEVQLQLQVSFQDLKSTSMWITQVSLWFALLFTISAGREQLVGEQQPARMQCINRAGAKWTSVPITKIGSSQLRQTGTQSFDIPSVIPSSATEVLILADVEIGYSGPQTTAHYVKIYTEQNSQNFAKYIIVKSYHQSAWSTNSDNMWFPMPTSRKVYIDNTQAHTQNLFLNLHAIGYR